MNRPQFLTFTGIDAHTDLIRARELSLYYPIEWGVLFSKERQGKENRYPSHMDINFIGAETMLTLSAHLCGEYAEKVLSGEDPGISLRDFDRVQINSVKPDQTTAAAFGAARDVTPIIQIRDLEFPEDQGCAMLFDRSGGRGVATTEWPRHPGGRLVGYAGGISPDNIRDVLEAVDSSGPYWLDMESGIRTNDLLDLDKCEAIANAVYG